MFLKSDELRLKYKYWFNLIYKFENVEFIQLAKFISPSLCLFTTTNIHYLQSKFKVSELFKFIMQPKILGRFGVSSRPQSHILSNFTILPDN